MRIFGLLSWYDEAPDWLHECVTSLADTGVDHVVAVDGAYALLDGGQASSGQEQHEAIHAAAHNAGVGCTLHVPQTVWQGGEIDKRGFMFALAEPLVAAGDDWYFVFDADQVVTTTLDLHVELEATELDVAETWFYEPCAPPDVEPFRIRNLFRALPDGRRLWGNPSGRALAPALDLTALKIEHRTYMRHLARREQQKIYYRRRDLEQIERPICDRCGQERSTTTVPTDWEFLNGMLAGGWVEVCKSCAPEEIAKSERRIRALSRPLVSQLNDPCPCGSGQRWHLCHPHGYGIDEVRVSRGKVPA